MASAARPFIALSLFLLAGCTGGAVRPPEAPIDRISTDSEPPDALEWQESPIGSIAFTNRSVVASKSLEAGWRLLPARDGLLETGIWDEFGNLIYRSAAQVKADDTLDFAWKGLDTAGKAVAADAYYLRLRLAATAETLAYDPSWITGGEMILGQDVATRRLDSSRIRVEFRLEKPARVSVNFGLLSGALVRAPLWMVPFATGKHSIEWSAGRDSTGLDLGKLPNLVHMVKGYALPANVLIVVEGARPDFRGRKSQAPPLQRLLRPVATQARFPVSDLVEPLFSLKVKNPQGFTPDGLPVVAGKVQVEIAMDKAERLRIARQRYELMMFVNFFGVFEDEEASLPFTFEWDAEGHRPGRHFITCNISTYADAFGSATLPVVIEGLKE